MTDSSRRETRRPLDDSALIVREARAADRPTIVRLHHGLQAFEILLRPTRRTPDTLPPDYVDELMGRKREGDGGVLVAERGGVPVGFVAYDVGEEVLEQHPAEVGVTDLVVVEGHRRRDVGRELLRAVEAVALARGAARITVTAIVENTEARAAYAALGFTPAYVTLEKPVDRAEA